MKLIVNGKVFEATLEKNPSAVSLESRLPLKLNMDCMEHEKYFYLDEPLPSAPGAVGRIEAGDLMLWGADCLVVFYEGFKTPYSYTRLGHIDDPRGLKEALGPGCVTIELKR